MLDFHDYGWNDMRSEAFNKLTTIKAVIPKGFEGWYRMNFPEGFNIGDKDSCSDDDRVLIALSQNENVSWAVTRRPLEIAEMVELSHQRPEWRPLRVMGTMRLTPARPMRPAQA